MLIFTTIKRKLVAAAHALDAVVVGLLHNVGLVESVRAPRFKYEFENIGPVEQHRARYVELRDKLEAMRADPFMTQFAVKASEAYKKLETEFLAIPTERKWADGFTNLVTTAGKNDLLTQYFKGASYTAAWYLLLIDNAGFSAVAAGDTAASHTGWTESTVYSNANRPTLSFGTASAASLAASPATFNINGTATINGAGAITNNTKGGATGILYSAGSFGATRGVTNGDTLNVTLTVTA